MAMPEAMARLYRPPCHGCVFPGTAQSKPLLASVRRLSGPDTISQYLVRCSLNPFQCFL